LGGGQSGSGERCGHNVPDSHQAHFEQRFVDATRLFKADSELRVDLTLPNVASAGGGGGDGSWTMVYDEGFEVVVNDRKFFAFFKYTSKHGHDVVSDKVGDYNSECGATLLGWFHDVAVGDTATWGCFVATKQEPAAASPPHTSGGAQATEDEEAPVLSPVTATIERSRRVRRRQQHKRRGGARGSALSVAGGSSKHSTKGDETHRKTVFDSSASFHSNGPVSPFLSKSTTVATETTASTSSTSQERRRQRGRRTLLTSSPLQQLGDAISVQAAEKANLQLRRAAARAESPRRATASHEHPSFLEISSSALFQPNYALIEAVNGDATSTWQAAVHEQWKGKTVKEMRLMLGAHAYSNGGAHTHAHSLAKALSSSASSSSSSLSSSLPADVAKAFEPPSTPRSKLSLPESFDWRDVDGLNYVPPVENQVRTSINIRICSRAVQFYLSS
jgi:hypothetical protein